MEKNIEKIVNTTSLKAKQIETVLSLTKEGNSIPFIARYRKEMTGSLDEVQIKDIIDQYNSLIKLDERKETILSKIEDQGKLTENLKVSIEQAEKMQELEEIYLPYKEKRRTKATIAKEQGLFPLAKLIMQNEGYIEKKAEEFITEDVPNIARALEGAVAILSEAISEDTKLRAWTLNEIKTNSSITSSLKDADLDEKKVFKMYYDFENKLDKLPNYRVLALNRGEKLGILSVKFENNNEKIERFFETRFNARDNKYLKQAIKDSLKKKIIPAMERQIRSEYTERAEDSAIEVFSENLRNLLLVAPLKGKVVLGFDPAFRTGAKLAVVDATGKLLETKVIYPVKPAKKTEIEQAKQDLSALVKKYGVEMIAIGNGTASRESEAFVSDLIKEENLSLYYVIVSESGASVYSASPLAREEFPELTVEKRSAISIARRLQDPLAELVKIDPQSIGVGQYQHDVSDKKLSENLDFVVETVVNKVGVNINTASSPLLSHVSGLNKTIAENIVKYREENGAIKSRSEIKKVPRLGAKAFEQSAGFLRIPDGENILDNTGVHPESYPVVKKLLKILEIDELNAENREKLAQVKAEELIDQLDIGLETLEDIIADLILPGRDLRDNFDTPVLRQDVLSIKDLKEGQKLEGAVRNVVDFGAFVDIGIKEDGLIHISKISKNFVKHPSEVVAVGENVTVWVDEIDLERGKVNLSLLDPRG
jgi:Transcriptional accessory protein